jgi:hypothetical protein
MQWLSILLLLLAAGSVRAEDPLPESIDYMAWSFPDTWPVSTVELDEVVRYKLNSSGTKGKYSGAATAFWRTGEATRLEVSIKITHKPDRARKERYEFRSHPDDIEAAGGKSKLPRYAKIRIWCEDGSVVKVKGKFRQDDGEGDTLKTKLKDPAGLVSAWPESGFTAASGRCALVVDGEGAIESLKILPDKELAAPSTEIRFLELERNGSLVPLKAVFRRGGEIVVEFDEPGARVRLAVDASTGPIGFRVIDAGSPVPDALRLRLTLPVLSVVDAALNGTYDEAFAVCLRPLTPNTHCTIAAASGLVTYSTEWLGRRGISGGEAAIVAAPRSELFDALAALEAEHGLPSPRFGGVRARESERVRESYLFLTYLGATDLEPLIEYARIGGFKRILFLRNLWLESAGTFGIDPQEFPGGLTEFAAACETIRDAGLGVGVHLYGPSVSLNDPLVTPVPDRRLLEFECPPLISALNHMTTRLDLEGAPDLPAPGSGTFPGTYLRVGDEIIRYSGTIAGPPFAFTDCERGALGTLPTAHPAGADVRHLATMWDQFLIDPESTLVAEVAANLARVVDTCGLDMVYLDGLGGLPSGPHHDDWYYANRTVSAFYSAFQNPVLMQTSMGPGRDLLWHVVPRSASADGHGDLKWYLDRRTTAIESMQRGFTAPDVGWYGFDEGRPPDQLEYVCARCLGWDCSISMQTHRPALESHARARETMEMVARYERCRQEGGLPASVREKLLEKGDDFRLLEGDDGEWHLYRVEYEGVRDLRTLTDGGQSWNTFNTAADSSRLGIEILRGDAAHVEADLSATGNFFVELFRDVDVFTPSGENDFARLVERTGKVVNANGAARQGVDHEFVLVDDPSVGGVRGTIQASNGNNTIGWCAVGRTFSTAMDLSGTKALGVWLRGDGSGISVALELWDDGGRRTSLRAPMHHDGWRLHTFPFSPAADFDAQAVRYLVIVASDLPPGRDVEVGFAALRSTPSVRAPAAISGARLRIGERVVTLPADLAPGTSARIDALGRLTAWPGGMAEGTTISLADGPIVLTPGTHSIRFEVGDPGSYPGDVSIRLGHLRRVYPD